MNKSENTTNMENPLENLTKERRQFLSRAIGHMKYTKIAEVARCSLDVVRAYAPIAHAEQFAASVAKQAAEAAKLAALQKAWWSRAAKLHESGDINAFASFLEKREGAGHRPRHHLQR